MSDSKCTTVTWTDFRRPHWNSKVKKTVLKGCFSTLLNSVSLRLVRGLFKVHQNSHIGPWEFFWTQNMLKFILLVKSCQNCRQNNFVVRRKNVWFLWSATRKSNGNTALKTLFFIYFSVKVASFRDGEGAALDSLLRTKDKMKKYTSYISGPWSDMYLCDRRSVCFNHNPGIALVDDPRPGFSDPAIRASNLLVIF